uniref:Uncharacterized protein n=1 Tax=Megaselia scalaris TaxID=36166 RepID=T1GQV0_MEGSC
MNRDGYTFLRTNHRSFKSRAWLIIGVLFYLCRLNSTKSFINSENISEFDEDLYLLSTPGCKIRRLDPFDPDIMKTVKIKPYEPCLPYEEYTRISFEPLSKKYTLSVKDDFKNLNCSYQKFFKYGDYGEYVSYESPIFFNKNIDIPETIDQIYVTCRENFREIYKNAYALMHYKKTPKPKVSDPISVVIVGIDSISRSSLIRNMPKTWNYIKSSKHWYHFNGYNRVGAVTYSNVIPLLAGQRVTDDASSCKAIDYEGIDDCPFIGNSLEIWDIYDIFEHATRGFKDPPTDHYLIPFFDLIQERLDIVDNQFCVGYKHGAEYVLDYLIDFVRLYRSSPYFGFFWMNTFSHDDANAAFTMDDTVMKYLQSLEHELKHQNTVVMFLSDHGLRYGPARQAKIALFEENLPMLNLWLPPSLRNNSIVENITLNTQRLVSTYDVYKTIFHLLEMSKFDVEDKLLTDCPNCQSILKPIASIRTCADAGIPSPFCSCNDYEAIAVESDFIISMSREIVMFMNNMKDTHKNGTFSDKCKDLSLGQIKDAHIYKTKIEHDLSLLTTGEKEFIEEVSKEIKAAESLFISFETDPNKAQFEVIILHTKILQSL